MVIYYWQLLNLVNIQFQMVIYYWQLLNVDSACARAQPHYFGLSHSNALYSVCCYPFLGSLQKKKEKIQKQFKNYQKRNNIYIYIYIYISEKRILGCLKNSQRLIEEVQKYID